MLVYLIINKVLTHILEFILDDNRNIYNVKLIKPYLSEPLEGAKMLKTGIIGYGGYVPMYRIKNEEIGRVWGRGEGFPIVEKSVPGLDEDSTTIAIEAAINALKRAKIDPKEISALFFGSESKVYAVKPTATIIAETIGATPEINTADFEFACKAGTEAMRAALNYVEAGEAKYTMAIGADTAQGAPGDELDYTAAAGGAAYIFGAENKIASIEGWFSFVTDTPDFWRREGQRYPRHGYRFTGEPAYFKHIVYAGIELMSRLGLKPSDIDYVVLHQPNTKFPINAAKQMGFPKEKVLPGLLTTYIGNTYSGAVPLGLARVLDVAKPGERILCVSFGSGAGSDAFTLIVEDRIEDVRDIAPKIDDYINRKKYIDYALYLRYRRLIDRGWME